MAVFIPLWKLTISINVARIVDFEYRTMDTSLRVVQKQLNVC